MVYNFVTKEPAQSVIVIMSEVFSLIIHHLFPILGGHKCKDDIEVITVVKC